jgi:hypothetical protein
LRLCYSVEQVARPAMSAVAPTETAGMTHD